MCSDSLGRQTPWLVAGKQGFHLFKKRPWCDWLFLDRRVQSPLPVDRQQFTCSCLPAHQQDPDVWVFVGDAFGRIAERFCGETICSRITDNVWAITCSSSTILIRAFPDIACWMHFELIRWMALQCSRHACTGTHPCAVVLVPLDLCTTAQPSRRKSRIGDQITALQRHSGRPPT